MKEAYYFSHDSNAKDDPKCSQLIEDLGLEGYGIYWVLVEILRDQPSYSYPLKMIPIIARKYNTTTPKVDVVVKNYGLFQIQNDMFFSLSLNKRMEQKEAKSLKARESANKRWLQPQSDGNANALQPQFDGNAIKERKVKEKKVKENKEINMILEIEKMFFAKPKIIESAKLWLKHKQEKKQPYKSIMWLVSMDSQISDFGENAVIEAINHGITCNYAGYFPKKDNNREKVVESKPYVPNFQSYEDLK